MIEILLVLFLALAILSAYSNMREDGSPTKVLFAMIKETVDEGDSILLQVVSIAILAIMMSPFLLLAMVLDIIIFLIVLCTEAELSLLSKHQTPENDIED